MVVAHGAQAAFNCRYGMLSLAAATVCAECHAKTAAQRARGK